MNLVQQNLKDLINLISIYFKNKTYHHIQDEKEGRSMNTLTTAKTSFALILLGICMVIFAMPVYADRTTTFTYDANGNVLTIDGPRTDADDITTFTYDAMGNRASMTVDPDGAGAAPAQVTLFTSYDNSGRLLSMTDPNGEVTDMTYDARGRLLTRTIAAGTTSAATTTFEYDGVGNVTKIILPSNNELSYTYDAAQRLTRITDRQGHYIQYTLDNLGNRTTEEVFSSGDVLRRTQSRVFDQLSRMIQSIGGVNQLTVFGYDGNGNQISMLDPLNRNSTSEYDGLQRLIKQTDADTNDTLYAYDARDNLTQVTDPRGIATMYTYNGLDDLTMLDSRDTGITTYTYDDAGNRTSQTNARNIITNYSYDALNRLTQIEYPGAAGLNVDFEYDTGTNRVGRLYRMLDNTGTYIYFYNKRGEVSRLRRNTQGSLYDIRYFYDKAGNVTRIEYPSGKQIQYVYNSIKRIREVRLIDGATTTNLATGIVYRQFGPMQKLIYGNGLTNTIGYDLDYRARNNRVLPVQDLRFFYDAANNIIDMNDITDRSKDQDFIYDNLDRLTQADGGYGLLNYTYDEVGNRLTRSEPTNTNTYVINATRNRINNYSDSASNLIDYNHNATGSVTKIDTDTYAYNRYERMSRATVGGVATTYRYDGKGQRTVKTDALGVKTVYIFDDDGQLISENQADGTTIREYVYLNGQPLAMLEGGNTYYYHLDHLGTPQKMTDATQTIVWQADYSPFGNATLVASTVTNNIRFPGQHFDAESGLHYNYFRDYNPNDGRYMQSDPIGLGGGVNTYSYGLSNPINNFDPDGLEVRFICRGVLGLPTGSQHCFVYVSCPTEGWQSVFSLFGDESTNNFFGFPQAGYKYSKDPTSRFGGPVAMGGDDIRDNPRSPYNEFNEGVQCASPQTCKCENEIRDNFNAFTSGQVQYGTRNGPNSNGFAADLILNAPSCLGLPQNVPGDAVFGGAPGISTPNLGLPYNP